MSALRPVPRVVDVMPDRRRRWCWLKPPRVAVDLELTGGRPHHVLVAIRVGGAPPGDRADRDGAHFEAGARLDGGLHGHTDREAEGVRAIVVSRPRRHPVPAQLEVPQLPARRLVIEDADPLGPEERRSLPVGFSGLLATLDCVSLLIDPDAFFTEHQRCGELDGGVDGPTVWISCDCGA